MNTFTEEEFKKSFEKVDKDNSGYITADEVENLLFETYGFPPLEEEVKSKQIPQTLNWTLFIVFMDEFDTNRDGRVSWEEFRNAL